MQSKEKKEPQAKTPEAKATESISLASMEFVMLDFLSKNCGVLQVQDTGGGAIFDLCLNREGQLCYVVPAVRGATVKLLETGYFRFVFTDQTIQLLKKHQLKMEEDNKARLTGFRHGNAAMLKSIVGFALEEKIEKPHKELELKELMPLLHELTRSLHVYREYAPPQRLYFVCTCKDDESAVRIRSLLSQGEADVWGEGCDLHFKKKFANDEIWDAKFNHGLVISP